MIVLPLWVQGLGWGGRGSDRGCAGRRRFGRLGLPERVLGKLETETAAQRPQAIAEGEIFLSSCSSHLGAGRTGGGGAELVYLGGRFWLAGNVAWAWRKEKRADASQPCFLFPRWTYRPGTGAGGAERGCWGPWEGWHSSRRLGLIPFLSEVHVAQGLGCRNGLQLFCLGGLTRAGKWAPPPPRAAGRTGKLGQPRV